MPLPPVLFWSMLTLGVFCVVGGVRRWRQGGRSQVFVGAMLLVQVAAQAPGVWIRTPAQVLMSLACLWFIARLFKERDPGALWISLVFCSLALVIVVTELIFDDLNWWQAVPFVAAAALLASVIATVVYRLRTGPPPSAVL